jgi:hypothetical protein
MTINEMIEALGRAKERLGGGEEIRFHVSENGKGDYLEIHSLEYSGFFGLTADISTPWWVYDSSKSHKP